MVTRPRLAASGLVALLAFVAGWLALLPGLAFWDTAELQAVGPLMGTAHPTGFPTYVILGWFASVVLQPFGEPAFRMNMLSAICVAVAAGVTVDLVRRLTGWVAIGIAAGIGMALTPLVWAIATHAEAHTLHLALIAVLLWLLVAWEARAQPHPDGLGRPVDTKVDRGDRFLVAAAVVFGLAIGNHSLTLLLAIPVGLYVLAVDRTIWRRTRLVLACVLALAVTVVLVYLELPLRAGPFRAPLVYGTPNTWEGFKYIVLAEQFQGSLENPFGDLPRKFAELLARAVTQFGILAPIIPLAFFATAVRRPRYALLTGTSVAITCFFSASYVNADISRYYAVPVLMAWTWLAILVAVLVGYLSGTANAAEDAPPKDGRPAPDATRAPRATSQDGDAPMPNAMAPTDRAEEDTAPTALVDDARPEDAGDDRPVVNDPADAREDPAPVVHPADGRDDPAHARTPAALLAFILGLMLIVPTLFAIPARYAAVDARRQTDAVTWTDRVMRTVEANAVIVSWWSYSTPLWYAQRVEGRRPDISIIDDRTRLDENLGGLTDVIDANLPRRPVYVIRADPREVLSLARRYDLDYIDGADASAFTRVLGLKTTAERRNISSDATVVTPWRQSFHPTQWSARTLRWTQ